MKNQLKSILLGASVIAVAGNVFAATKEFQIVTDKLAYRNVATVESVSDFETFTGRTNQVSGTIQYDAASGKGGGTVVVDVASIDTGIPLRNDHMKSAGWLDAAKYPTIKFVTTKVQKMRGDSYKVFGNLTLHGVTKPVTGEARVRFKAAGDATKAAGFDGDVTQLNAKVAIKLNEFGVMIPDMAKGKVANDVTLTLSAYAVAK